MKFITKLFYHTPTYAKCLKWGVLKSLGYLIFITALTTAAGYLTIFEAIKTSYIENIDTLKSALGKVKINNGKIQPYLGEEITIKDNLGETFAIISPNSIDAHKIKNLVFSIEGKRLSIYQEDEEITFDLSTFNFGSTTNLAETLPSWREIKFAIMPFTVFVISLSITFWHTFMLGTFAFIIDIPHKKLRFFNSLKLGMLALTPATIISLGYTIAFRQILPEFITVVISSAMLYFVVSNFIKKSTKENQ